MTDKNNEFPELEGLFDAARQNKPVLSDDLHARIMSDAMSVMPSNVVSIPSDNTSWWRRWLEPLGGWPALGGMVTACAAGIWIGIAPPASLPDPIQFVQSADTDLFGEIELLTTLSEEN